MRLFPRSLSRAGRKREQPSLEVRWSSDQVPAHPPISPVILVVFGLIAIGCFVLGPLVDYPKVAAIIEHVGIAFVVAIILGGSYEYILHSYRERLFRRLLDEHREKLFETLKVHLLLTPEQIFDFLSEIAVQTKETPTLYRPARSANEYTFANSIKYFNMLLEVRRVDVISVLRRWIESSSHDNLKFLASDFVGMYQLHELAPDLQDHASRELGDLSEGKMSWVLNYVWAVSRCQSPKYKWLGQILSNSSDPAIQKWIIFVARQMPEREMGDIIRHFLKVRSDSLSDDVLGESARALAALQRANAYDGWQVLRQNGKLFGRPGVLEIVRNSCSDLGVPVELLELHKDQHR